MHILLIHQAFAAVEEPGGTRHHELARYLVSQGHKVTVVASPVSYLTGSARGKHIPWIERQEQDGVSIWRAYTYPAFHRSFLHRMISFFSFMVSSFFAGMQVKNVDAVWGTSPPIFQGVTAWAVARLKRTPLLFEVRDLWPAFAIGVGVLRQPVLIRLSEWLESFLYRHADLVMVNSPGFIQHILTRGARRVELVPNGADPRMFDPYGNGLNFRQKHGLEGKFIALYAGAHGMSNDLGVVLEAARRLQESPVQSNIAIVLLGDGKEKTALIEQAKHMGLRNIHFLPSVPKLDMSSALAASDACIAILKPIEWYKTVYPNKVFDYMAAGRPVILAIGGVIQEVVETAQAGIFVSPGDPVAMADVILWLATHPVEGRQMGLRGRKTVEEHFDRAVIATQLEEIFRNLVRKQN